MTIADVNAEKGAALASELGVEFVACDVREEEQVQAAVEQAAQAEGGLRIAVVLRGRRLGAEGRGLQRAPPAAARSRRVIQINLIGTFNALRHAAAAMIANEPSDDAERGVLVYTASIAAYDGQVGQIAYSASKGGIVSLTLPAARDLAQYGIRVNTIAPGLFDTPLLAALPEEARQKLGRGRPLPSTPGSARRVCAARLPHRREPDAQRRDDPARRRAANAASLKELRRGEARPGSQPAFCRQYDSARW